MHAQGADGANFYSSREGAANQLKEGTEQNSMPPFESSEEN